MRRAHLYFAFLLRLSQQMISLRFETRNLIFICLEKMVAFDLHCTFGDATYDVLIEGALASGACACNKALKRLRGTQTSTFFCNSIFFTIAF